MALVTNHIVLSPTRSLNHFRNFIGASSFFHVFVFFFSFYWTFSPFVDFKIGDLVILYLWMSKFAMIGSLFHNRYFFIIVTQCNQHQVVLTRWGRGKMAAILNSIFLTEIFVFWLKFHWWLFSMVQWQVIIYLSHTPLCISMISGVCVQGMWNAQVKGQVTETHRLKVNSHCDTTLFISVYDITMAQP